MYEYGFVRSFYDTILDVLEPYIANLGSLMALAVGIGFLFMFFNKIWGALVRIEPIDLYPLLRPFVVALLCINFATLVQPTIDLLLEPVSGYCAKIADDLTSFNVQEEALKKAAGIDKETNNNSASIWDILNTGIVGAILWIINILIFVLDLVVWVVIMLIQLIRLIFLAILALIGPIALGLSVFPGFENNFQNWLSKYISIFLWGPIATILVGINGALQVAIINSGIISINTISPYLTGLVASILIILTYFLSLLSMLCIPMIGTWIVSGGESAHGMTSFLSSLAAPTKWAMGAIGAAAGIGHGKAKQKLTKK